jgi:hypothetical protein
MRFVEKLGEQSIFLYELYFIYAFMAYKNNFAFTMVVAILGNIVLNMILKGFVIQFGKTVNHRLPLFGSLCRPKDTNCTGINMIGYGTPSGHSQIVSFVAAFYYFYYKDTVEYSRGKFGVLVSLAVFTMITRYTSSMHSIPQILLGGSIGIGLAYVFKNILYLF